MLPDSIIVPVVVFLSTIITPGTLGVVVVSDVIVFVVLVDVVVVTVVGVGFAAAVALVVVVWTLFSCSDDM